MIVVVIGVMAENSSGDKVELYFISCCAPVKSSAAVRNDEELLINLQDCHDINRPSDYEAWTNKMITPLRDRLVHHVIVCCYGDGYQDNDILVVWITCS